MRVKNQENLVKHIVYTALILILIPVTVFIVMATILYAVYVIPKIPNYIKGENDVSSKISCPMNFVELETGCYTIGKFMKSGELIDWFDLNVICEEFSSLPVSIESANELDALTAFILMEDFENATTFATSGYLTFDETSSYDLNSAGKSQQYFTWYTTGERLNYTKWFESDADQKFYDYCVALVLIDVEVYMKKSSCQEDYFICEYQGKARLLSMRAEYYLHEIKDMINSVFA